MLFDGNIFYCQYFYEWNSRLTFLDEKLTVMASGSRFSPSPTWRFSA
jgi:hypothetical protein